MEKELKAAVYGFAVVDSLGVPYEFKERGFEFSEDNSPLIWSDDTAMTLAAWDSIRRNGGIDLEDMMKSFEKWYFKGKYTPNGITFGVGRTTTKAIESYHLHKDIENCGQRTIRDNGNGALMRILPRLFVKCTAEEIDGVSGLTHNHGISKEGCRIYVEIGKRLLHGQDLRSILSKINVSEIYKRIPFLEKLSEDEIRSTGFVVDTLEAAIWCILKTGNYRDCIVKAIELGQDTDTTAAVAGGLAAIVYGYHSIPKDWLEKLQGRERIAEYIGY